MNRLSVTRAMLVLSTIAFFGAVLLSKAASDRAEAAMLIGILALSGMVFSATACAAFQMLGAVRSQVSRNV